jgi:predicted aldo/keto reductase-like oxidoreductase
LKELTDGLSDTWQRRGEDVGDRVGGWHLGLRRVDEQMAIRIVRSAIDGGINSLDNSWDYNDGAREVRMGKALRGLVTAKYDSRALLALRC